MVRSHAEGRTVTTLLDLMSDLFDLLGEERRVTDVVIRLIREGRLRFASGRTLALSHPRGFATIVPAVRPARQRRAAEATRGCPEQQQAFESSWPSDKAG